MPATPPQDPFEMFRRLWGPLGVPVPGLAMPTLDPEEIEKRIADLRSVETWLGMNLNMVRLSISGLEVQRSALQAMRAAGDAGRAAVPPSGAPGEAAPLAQAMLWPFTLMQQVIAGNTPAQDAPAADVPPGDRRE